MAGKKNEPKSPKSAKKNPLFDEGKDLSNLRIPASLHFPRREAAEAENKGQPEGHGAAGPGPAARGGLSPITVLVMAVIMGVLLIVFCTQMYKLYSNFLALHKTLNPRKYDVSSDFGFGEV